VQVVVVVCEYANDARRSDDPGVRADEDNLSSGRHEAVDQILREPKVCLARPERGPLAAVSTRVVDVHVEAVLMRDVAGSAELAAEFTPVGATQIADADAWRAWVVRGVLPDHA
jgi:hypothetical protein